MQKAFSFRVQGHGCRSSFVQSVSTASLCLGDAGVAGQFSSSQVRLFKTCLPKGAVLYVERDELVSATFSSRPES